jgi:hypothetical protein
MKTPPIAALAALLAASFALGMPARGADDKQLQNMRGDVSFQVPNGAAKPLAPNAVTAIADKDYAITGKDSLAAVGLPDSSRVLVGAETKVQLAFFNQAAAATAKFLIYNGKVRFVVQHPQGAKADYTFQTPTATIGVRGTEGDIETTSDSFQVNVYEVCDASQPVTVTTKDGKSFQLVAGQSLVAQLVNGIVQEKVEQLTQQMINQFSPDFGVPTSWDAAKGEIVGMASSQAANAVNNATGGVGGGLVGNAIGGLFSHKSTPAPTASPKSDTCTHS